MSKKNPFTMESSTKSGSVQAFFFDKNGNPIMEGSPQTTVKVGVGNAASGIFYMSFKLRARNIGAVPLSNVEFADVLPSAILASALTPGTFGPYNISVGSYAEINTANLCPGGQSQCTGTEQCVGSTPTCRIPVGDFTGDKPFGFTLLGTYTNALGQVLDAPASIISLTINFAQDEAIYRTSALNDNFVIGSEVVVDKENDGTMEVYTYSATGSGGNYAPADFIGWTVFNRLVYKCGTSTQICVSQVAGLNKDISQTISFWRFNLGGTLTTIKTPTPPYNDICDLIACRERYSVQVTQPSPICSNNIKEGTEVCDGTDLSPYTSACSTYPGFTGGTLSCNAQCTAFVTSSCTTGGGGNPNQGKIVLFRTLIGGCVREDWIGSTPRWISFDYDNINTNNLVGYGQTSTAYSGTRNTDDFTHITAVGGTSPCGYIMDTYAGDIFVSNVGGSIDDAKFTSSLFTAGTGLTEHLSNQACCGYTCGSCCERYSDGTTNC